MYKTWVALILLQLPCIGVAKDCVVLLHGLARGKTSMSPLEKKLNQAGYLVVNQAYASRKKTIEELSVTAISSAKLACDGAKSIHFVTHSMGGILVRYYLSKNTIGNLGRVVMLGPPNKGSEVVDKMKNVPGFRFINGKAGMQLGTGRYSLPNTIGSAGFDLGIIAGTKSINLLLSTQIPGTDDGKVSIDSTKLKGMNHHITMPVTHTFMMRNKRVIEQVLYYLERGQFLKSAS